MGNVASKLTTKPKFQGEIPAEVQEAHALLMKDEVSAAIHDENCAQVEEYLGKGCADFIRLVGTDPATGLPSSKIEMMRHAFNIDVDVLLKEFARHRLERHPVIVIRDGTKKEVHWAELVPGDIIEVEHLLPQAVEEEEQRSRHTTPAQSPGRPKSPNVEPSEPIDDNDKFLKAANQGRRQSGDRRTLVAEAILSRKEGLHQSIAADSFVVAGCTTVTKINISPTDMSNRVKSVDDPLVCSGEVLARAAKDLPEEERVARLLVLRVGQESYIGHVLLRAEQRHADEAH